MKSDLIYPALGLLAQHVQEKPAAVERNKLLRAVELIVAQADDKAVTELLGLHPHLRWIKDEVTLPYYRRQNLIEQEVEGMLELVDAETPPAVREEMVAYYGALAGQADRLEPVQRSVVVCAAKGMFIKAKRQSQPNWSRPANAPRQFEAGANPEPGMMAWVVIEKKGGGGRKQAKCLIEAVEAEQVTAIITKTGQQVRRPVAELFDHVPHLVDGVWV